MSDSEDDLNVDISQWKPRSINTAPRPANPPPRTFASINTLASTPRTTTAPEDDDEDIDAIIEELAASDSGPEPVPAPTQAPRKLAHVLITSDPNFDRAKYQDRTYGSKIVHRVVREYSLRDDVFYKAEFVDSHSEQVSLTSIFFLNIRLRPMNISITTWKASLVPCPAFFIALPSSSPHPFLII